jgi:putative DNA primase/helicase
MKFDGTIDIATGMSAKSKLWKNKKFKWSELVGRLGEEHKTTETFKEYMAASKDEQAKIKDVGGFVGGYLRQGRRKPENVVHRQLITLDIDFAHNDFWDDFCMQFSNAAVLHGTHKYSRQSPRFRLVMPLSREVTPDEYVAVSRRIAGHLDIELFDNTTFQPERLMYWPSSPKDVDYYFQIQDGPWVDVDEVLATYIDWKDSSLWPTSESQLQKVKTDSEKQQDPEEKKGLVGAFCRAYSITQVIDKYLSDIYTPTFDGRYTYVKGSTASGVVVYEDKFVFSHHGTDPCGGMLCNAFDLVRIHKYGILDEGGTKGKSYSAMIDLVRKDVEVKKIIASENIKESKYEFASTEEISVDWMAELEVDTKGRYLSTAQNINLIFSNDQRIRGLFRHNKFDNKSYIFGTSPWRKITSPEPLKNVDFSGLRNYLESIYGIVGTQKVDDVLNLELDRHSFHPVRDYLNGLEWDGTKRVDTLFIDYLGAEDNVYTREAARKMLVGAVGRILAPGIKFDLVVTLIGSQGIGKSTLLKKIGLEWFSDTFMTVHGKEALEQIQGAWVIEMAELSGLKKAEVEPIKHFISKQEDIYRPAYGKSTETYPRQCIFVATTNDRNFLKDPSGNRRFIPVDTNISQATKSVFNLTREEIDQLWAEALELFYAGETLFMSALADKLAKIAQREHSENDERRGLIEDYLAVPLPKNWSKLDIFERRMYLNAPLEGTQERDFVCVAEVWCECLGKEKENMDRYKTKEINDILRTLEGWEEQKSTKNFGFYGKQRYYSRKLS